MARKISLLAVFSGIALAYVYAVMQFTAGSINAGIFYGALGTTSLVIIAVLEATYPHPIVASVSASKSVSTPTEPEVNRREGYVYLLRTLHDSTAFKIGRTKNPKNRIKTFATKFPFKVQYVCLLHTNDMITLEKQLHDQFASQRLDGEFFRLSQSDVQYIKSLGATK